MNFQTTIVLLVLVLLIGGYFLTVERGAQTTYEREDIAAQQKDNQGLAVFTPEEFSTESVEAIEVERDGEKVRLEREGTDWWQTQPVRFALKTWTIRQIIDDTAGLRYTQRVSSKSTEDTADADGLTLESTSLSAPKAVLTLHQAGSDSNTHKMHLGRTSIGGRAYARFNDDDRIYVVNDDVHRMILEQNVWDWRDQNLNGPDEGVATRVTLSRTEGANIDLIKADDGQWGFGSSGSGRADRDTVKEILDGIGRLYIDRFVADAPEDPSVFSLDQPQMTLAIQAVTADLPEASGEAPELSPQDSGVAIPVVWTLTIGGPVDLTREEYFATWRQDSGGPLAVFVLGKQTVESLPDSVDELRDPRVTPIKAKDVQEFSVQRPGEPPIKLLRGVEGWSFADPDPGFQPDDTTAHRWLQSVTTATTKSFATEPGAGSDALLGEPVITVTITAIGRPQPDTLRIYSAPQSSAAATEAPDSHAYLVYRNGETVGYVISPDQFAHLTEPIEALRDRTVLAMDSDQVQSVVITNRHGVTYEFSRSSGDTESQSTQPTTKPTGDDLQSPDPMTDSGASVLTWQLAEHDTFEASDFQRLLSTLLPLRAEQWLEAGDTSPQQFFESNSNFLATVEITSSDGDPKILIIDTSTDRAALLDTGEWFEPVLGLLPLINTEFRDRTALALDLSEIQSVVIAHRDRGAVTIVRDVVGRYSEPGGREVDQAAAGAVFDSLAGLRVERYVDPIHALPPELTVTIRITGGQEHTLTIPGMDDLEHHATLGEGWFLLPDQTLQVLHADLITDKLDTRIAPTTAPLLPSMK